MLVMQLARQKLFGLAGLYVLVVAGGNRRLDDLQPGTCYLDKSAISTPADLALGINKLELHSPETKCVFL